MRLSALGTNQVDCPVTECPQYQCYQECEHRSIVYDLVDVLPFQSQEFLSQLLVGILDVQEELIQEICEPITDICERGFRVNLDCIQCALSNYELIPSECAGYNEVNFDFQKSWIDLSSVDYIDIYTAIVDFLQCYRGDANGDSVTAFAQSIGGDFLGFSNSTYHVLLPNNPVLLGISNLLTTLVPAPFGAQVKFYTEI